MGDLLSNPLLMGAAFLIGSLIGATGIGGLFLPPSIHVIAGVPIQTAVPASVATFALTGVAGTTIYLRKASIAWRELLPLAAGAGPAAFVGSLLLAQVPGASIQGAIAVLAVISGIAGACDIRWRTREAYKPGALFLFVTGCLVGLLSALTGTGGPLVLLPILLLLGLPALQSVGLAQAIQIPIGLLATTGNVLLGSLDGSLIVPVAVAVVVGSIAGALSAHRLPTRLLKMSLGVVMAVAGALYGISAL